MKLAHRLVIPAFIGCVLALAGLGIYFKDLRLCLKPSSLELIRYCFGEAEKLEPGLTLLARLSRQPQLLTSTRLLAQAKPFLGQEDFLLGINRPQPTTYLVLLQNDTELRANGGFVGSYAVISAQNGQFTTRFQDIYVPDGQLQGHVEPPAPIQTAFKQGWWKLRDADWSPDFPTSATTIRWFLTQGKEIEPDFLLTLNLASVKEILALTGPVAIPEYDLEVDADNVYQFLQSQAEVGFFPGSTQKRDALAALGKSFLNRLSELNYSKKLAIATLLLDQLEQQNLLINALDPQLQEIILAKNWGGQLTPPPPVENSLNDYLAIIETNLGANKANCCITRQTKHELSPQGGFLVHKITLDYTNSSPSEHPTKPDFYGGNYIQYLRVYLPPEAVFVEVTALPTLPSTPGSYPLADTGQAELLASDRAFGFQEWGFFHITRAGSSSQVQLSYSLPRNNKAKYQLTLFKQHGLVRSPQEIYFGNQNWQTELNDDFQLSQTLD